MEDIIPTSTTDFERNVNNDVNYKNLNLNSSLFATASIFSDFSVPRNKSLRIIFTPELPSSRIVDDSQRICFLRKVCYWKKCPNEDSTSLVLCILKIDY